MTVVPEEDLNGGWAGETARSGIGDAGYEIRATAAEFSKHLSGIKPPLEDGDAGLAHRRPEPIPRRPVNDARQGRPTLYAATRELRGRADWYNV